MGPSNNGSNGNLVSRVAGSCTGDAWSPEAAELLVKLLTCDDHMRISARDSLGLPYFRALHEPTDEPDAASCASEMSFDTKRLSAKQLHRLIFAETQAGSESLAGRF